MQTIASIIAIFFSGSAAVKALSIPSADFQPKILISGSSGASVSSLKYPNLVSLQQVGYHYCTGILLDSSTVLTSASCSIGRNPSPLLEAVLGSNDLKNETLGLRMPVVKITKHPLFDKASLRNDLAIWKLQDDHETVAENPSTGTGGTKPSKAEMGLMPVDLDYSPGSVSGKNSLFTIAGWGATQDGGEMLLKLQEAQVSVIDQKTCFEAYKDQPYDLDSMICARGSQGQDTCDGDSGKTRLVIALICIPARCAFVYNFQFWPYYGHGDRILWPWMW